MSLITRCPACGTMFKVVPDQLRISEGWVRCGHCAEVFDATASLQSFAPEELAPVTPGQAPQADSPAATRPAGMALPPAAGVSTPPVEVALPPEKPPVPVPDAAAPAPTPPPASDAAPQPGALPPPDFDLDSLLPQDDGARTEPTLAAELALLSGLASSSAMPLPASDLSPVPPQGERVESPADATPALILMASRSALPDDETDEDVAAQEASFVRDARRKARWRSTPVRLGLSVLALLLAGVLAGQMAYQERERLAVWQPALKPLLAQGCEWLGCTVGPVRQIEAVAIESSAFQRIRGEAYRLSISLRNQSDWPLAMPAIELTLTDAVDQPVVRRVLTPAELGSASGVLAPQSEQPATVALSVAASAGQARVAGYRILAFYP